MSVALICIMRYLIDIEIVDDLDANVTLVVVLGVAMLGFVIGHALAGTRYNRIVVRPSRRLFEDFDEIKFVAPVYKRVEDVELHTRYLLHLSRCVPMVMIY